MAERRLVSVLFADLVGFTTLSESRDAEAVRELLARYFETANRIIGSYGGIVEKFIGDAVMAVWGAPTAHEDDAERAVRTALDLVDAVRAMGEELGAELTARVGVLTGEAAVTLGATNQGMVAGDLVNTASRLQSAAEPGTVLVGQSTFQAAGGAVAFEPAGEHALKGKELPVAAYRALRVVARRGGAGRSEQLEAPFVGRGPELRMLKDFHAATGSERRPRLISIIGQGGVGKSRLVWEFQKYLDGVTEDVYWHQGRSPAYGEGISFWALAEMVRGRAGVTDADDPAAARAKLAHALSIHVPDTTERRWLEPRLLQLLGLETAETGERPDRESLFAAWRTLFERIADKGVVVLVFEDLQWADDGMLDFIDHVMEWSRDRPIFVITLARPELLDRRRDWGSGMRSFTSLVLDPLDADAMRELLAGMAPGLPESIVELVLERADGIPLYAVETMRMLFSEGRLERDGDVYRPTGDLSELAVPTSLHALIASRLDGLEVGARSLLQAGSVIGKTFTLRALAATSGREEEEVARDVRDLVRREFLTLDVDPRSPEQGQYGFVQSLIREVAYGTLARRDRRRLHLAAARYSETLEDEGIAGALADHYLAAYHAQPEGPEGDAVAAQARVALRAAADRARSLGSFVQAMRFFELALEVTTDPDERWQLQSAARDAGLFAGRAIEAKQHADAALELAEASGDRARILTSIAGKALSRSLEGQAAESVALVSAAREEYRDLGETAEYVTVSVELARSTLLRGQFADAVRIVDETLPTSERLELTHDTLHLIVTRGAALAALGRIQEGIAVLTGAVAMSAADGTADPDVELRARVNLSYAAAAENPLLSYRTARDGYETARRLGMRSHGYYLLGNAADGALRIGDWEWVRSESEEAVADENDLAARIRLAQLRGMLGDDVSGVFEPLMADVEQMTEVQALSTVAQAYAEVMLANGDPQRALELAQTAYRTDSGPDTSAYQVAIRAAAQLGDEGAIREGLDQLRERPGRVASIAAREGQAALAAVEGRHVEARAGFADAIRGWNELGLQFDAAQCALLQAILLGPGDASVRAALEEATAFFERVGSAPLLRQARDAVAAGALPTDAGHDGTPATVEGAGRGRGVAKANG